MSGSKEPKTCCDRECAEANDCIEGGVECDRCGRYFCSQELDERGLCAECAKERVESEEQEAEDGE